MNFKSIIYVAGHNGLVGSAIVRELKKKGFKKIIVDYRKKLDLTKQGTVLKFLKLFLVRLNLAVFLKLQ